MKLVKCIYLFSPTPPPQNNSYFVSMGGFKLYTENSFGAWFITAQHFICEKCFWGIIIVYNILYLYYLRTVAGLFGQTVVNGHVRSGGVRGWM